eukprot:2073241-Pyramimonas_sp.AAC.1
MLRVFAPICSRANQCVYPKPPVPALVAFDHASFGVYLPYLPRAFIATPNAREERTGGRGKEKNGAREKFAGGGQGVENQR